MKMTNAKKALSFFLCIVLIAVMALFTTGCSGNTETPDENSQEASSQTAETASEDESLAVTAVDIGEGNTTFTFTVTHNDGTQKIFNVSTDKATVGEALMDNGIIAGDDGQYGLYVKTVDGEKRMAPVGYGELDFEKIIASAERAGACHLLVEQDHTYGEDPFECLTRSYKYLKSLGLD